MHTTPFLKIAVLCLVAACVPVSHSIYMTSNATATSSGKQRRHSSKIPSNPADWADDGIFSPLLEQWALRPSGIRDSRVLKPTSMTHVYITNRIGEEDAIPNPNRPQYYQQQQQQQYQQQQQQQQQQQRPPGKLVTNNGNGGGYIQNQNNGYPQASREVSETDLYLLSAIEKLVYRVDFMEKRLRRMEQMLYHVVSGNGNNKVADPCPGNFTRAGANCYYFGADRELNWKAASASCHKMDAMLLEMESVKENQQLIAHIQSDLNFKGKDFWTGGLNPGLLWIWSNSARPVITENSATNATMNALDIKGSGRCLKLSYNPPLRAYAYFGEDCSTRQYYVCEKQDKTISNEISRMARELNFGNEFD